MLSLIKKVLFGSDWKSKLATVLEELLEKEAIEALEKECGKTAKTADVVHAIVHYLFRKLGL